MKTQNRHSWVKLYTKLVDHPIMMDHKALALFIHILCIADQHGEGIITQNVTSSRIGIKPSAYRKVLMRLVKRYEIIKVSAQNWRRTGAVSATTSAIRPATTKITRFSVCNWEDYQSLSNNLSNNLSAVPAQSQRRTSNTIYKNKNKSKNKNIYTDDFISLFNELFKKQYRKTDGRVSKLTLRLKTFSYEEIKKAVIALSQSSYHTGKNENGWEADPDFLLRSDEQVDKWLSKYKPNTKSIRQKTLADQVLEAQKGNYAHA